MKKFIIPAIVMMIIAIPNKNVDAADTYKVQSGDTLWGISQKTYTSIENIKTYNEITNNIISIGQILNLSSTVINNAILNENVYHTVKTGDTLWNISVTYKVTMDEIMKWNNMTSTILKLDSKIIVGEKAIQETAKTTTDLHLRATASSTSSSLIVIPSGATVKVLDKTDAWWKLEYNGKIGFSNKEYLQLITSSNNVSHIYISKVSGLFKEPGKIYLSAMKPAKVEVIQTGENGWYQVKTWLGSLWVKDGVMTETKAPEPVINYVAITKMSGLFKEPGKTYVSTMKPAKVQVVQTGQNGWYKVKTWLGELWVKDGVLKEAVTASYAKTTTNLNLRETANGVYITTIPSGSQVEVLNDSSSWWKINYNGKIGYSSSEYLTRTAKEVIVVVPANGKIVVLDPGHGGVDSGAVGVGKAGYEETVNLQHSLKTKLYLERLGYKVYMTRSTDKSCIDTHNMGVGVEKSRDLDCRVKYATSVNADILVSVHSNATIPGIRGTETYYNETVYNDQINPFPAQSKRLAQEIHAKYQPAFASNNRGVRNQEFYVNRNATMPSVLLEIGYLTDTSDLYKLINNTRQELVSKAIADGINNYFK